VCHVTTSTCFLVPVQFWEQAGTSLAYLSCSDGTVTAVHHSVTGFRSNYGLDVTNEHVCVCVCVCVCVHTRALLCVRLCACTRTFLCVVSQETCNINKEL
jgi:hypothetical protein